MNVANEDAPINIGSDGTRWETHIMDRWLLWFRVKWCWIDGKKLAIIGKKVAIMGAWWTSFGIENKSFPWFQPISSGIVSQKWGSRAGNPYVGLSAVFATFQAGGYFWAPNLKIRVRLIKNGMWGRPGPSRQWVKAVARERAHKGL